MRTILILWFCACAGCSASRKELQVTYQAPGLGAVHVALRVER